MAWTKTILKACNKRFFIGSILIVFCGVAITWITLPSTNDIKQIRLQEPLKIVTQDHKLIATFGEKKRFPTTFDKIPEQVRLAFLAAEDQRFYHHHGVDPIGLMRAVSALIIKRGKITQGASTITMQVARNFYLSRKQTFGRKFKEILLSLKIEHALSKNKILELYLNKIFIFLKTPLLYNITPLVFLGITMSEI